MATPTPITILCYACAEAGLRTCDPTRYPEGHAQANAEAYQRWVVAQERKP